MKVDYRTVIQGLFMLRLKVYEMAKDAPPVFKQQLLKGACTIDRAITSRGMAATREAAHKIAQDKRTNLSL